MKHLTRILALSLTLLILLCNGTLAQGNAMDVRRCDSGETLDLLVYTGGNTGNATVTVDGESVDSSSNVYSMTGEGTSWIYLIDTKSVYVQTYSPATYFVSSLIDKQGENDNMVLFYNGKSELEFLTDKETASSLLTTKPYTGSDKNAPSLDQTLQTIFTGLDAAENVKKHICLVLVTGGTGNELPDYADILREVDARNITVYTVVMQQKNNSNGKGTPADANNLAKSSFGGCALVCEWSGNNDKERGECTATTVQALADNENRFMLVQTKCTAKDADGKVIIVSVGEVTSEVRQIAAVDPTAVPDVTVTPDATVTPDVTVTPAPTATPTPTAVPFPKNVISYISGLGTAVKVIGCVAIVLIIAIVVLLVRKAVRKNKLDDIPDDPDEEIVTIPDGLDPDMPPEPGPTGDGPAPLREEPIVLITLTPIGNTQSGNIEFEISGKLMQGITVGRDGNKVNVVITSEDKKVSGRHAAFAWKNGRLLIADAGSTNGTWVNGTRIDKPVVLREDDKIGFGPYSVYKVKWTKKYR